MPPPARKRDSYVTVGSTHAYCSRVLVICASVPSLCLLKQIAHIVTSVLQRVR